MQNWYFEVPNEEKQYFKLQLLGLLHWRIQNDLIQIEMLP